ncbi:MAG: carboxylating nicotinate-nucleotide diphosphorylase [Thermonemataceae bacterium]
MENLPYLKEEALQHLIDQAILEDIGEGDHSSLASIPAEVQSKAQLIIKDEGILAGVALAAMIFKKIDPALTLETHITDGTAVKPGEIGFQVAGKVHSILKAERLVLNCMQRMSGIATKTHHLKQLISHTKARLLDTRKTTPNFRILEKWAVAIGGGKNHRFALYDMIMLKDNHIDFAGGITKAVKATHQYLANTGKKLEIEVETRTLAEVEEVLAVGGVQVIMLDNMSPALMKEAVTLIGDQAKTEASGGITAETIKEVAETGVDYISVGALTHSFKSLDMSLKAL